jgi:adenosylcobinamide-GDP ribazoletransferase
MQPAETSPSNEWRLRAVIAEQWCALWAAVQFLSRLPVPDRFVAPTAGSGTPLARATIYFPLVGAIIGLISGGFIWIASHFWPLWLAVLLGLALEALVTGALHEDALADCCDALGGGWTRADVLRILDDSRSGAYGVLGLTLGVLLRAGSMASLTADIFLPAVVCSAAVGRWAMVLALAWLAPVPERPSLAHLVGRQRVSGHLLGAALTGLPAVLPLALLWPARFALALVAVVALTAAFVYYLRRRIGGITGDCVGAISYLSQIVVLLCCAARGP